MSTPIDISVSLTSNSSKNASNAPAAAAPAAATDALDQALPFIIFPPFPTPPPGASVIPFKAFKPSGIVPVPVDAPPDYVEVDAHGVPTTTLRVRHSLTESEQKKKSSAKAAAKRTTGPDGIVRRLMWWEQWEQNESIRRTTAIHTSVSRVDRLHQASQEFKAGRPWPALPSGVPQLWDAFRLYVGIISSTQPPLARKRQAQMRAAEAAIAEDDDDDDDDDETGFSRPTQQEVTMLDPEQAMTIVDKQLAEPLPPRKDISEEELQQRREDFREAKDSRMDSFFNDMETNIKIFLSSYFREKGLIWVEQRARDAPILLRFFLDFLLRSRVLPEPEYEAGIRKALVVTNIAAKELPMTFITGKILPDAFSLGCEALFGNMTERMVWQRTDSENTGTGQSETSEAADEPEAKRQKLDDAAAQKEEEETIKGVFQEPAMEVVSAQEVENVAAEIEKNAAAAEADVSGNGESNGWGAGWGSGSWDEAAANGDAAENNPWEGDNSMDGWDSKPKPNPLMAFLGPTVLALTHTTGIVERSTRRVKAVTPPTARGAMKSKGAEKSAAELVDEELSERFARLVLEPWLDWAVDPDSDVARPTILPDSRGPVINPVDQSASNARDTSGVNAILHDPFKDDITVLIEPSAVDKVLPGMGLQATWVQIARQRPDSVDWFDEKTCLRLGGHKGGPGELGEPTPCWYMEHLIAILTSYHTEV